MCYSRHNIPLSVSTSQDKKHVLSDHGITIHRKTKKKKKIEEMAAALSCSKNPFSPASCLLLHSMKNYTHDMSSTDLKFDARYKEYAIHIFCRPPQQPGITV